MKKPITISLSPNFFPQDTAKAFSLLCAPWSYIKGDSIRNLEQWFRQYFNISYAISFNSGRSALFSILRTLGISKDDEVIMQGFTCVVVPAAVVLLGAVPIYADIKKDLTLDPDDVEKKITKKTKAILVQHTFGIPTDMKRIMVIANKHKIPVIEDVAHTIGGAIGNKKLGTFGVAAFFSLGRDKAFSSVFGGIAITNNEEFGKKLRNYQKQLPTVTFFWTLQQLLHPLAFSLILPVYNFMGLGKLMLVVLQKLHFLSFPVTSYEKKGVLDKNFIRKMPNALAGLALVQLRRIKEFNTHRETISGIYNSLMKNIDMPKIQKTPLLRFPIYVENPNGLVAFLKNKGIYVGRWYSEVIDPKGSELLKVNYKKGDCEQAEKWASHIVNLPTHPTLTTAQAKTIVELVNRYVKS